MLTWESEEQNVMVNDANGDADGGGGGGWGAFTDDLGATDASGTGAGDGGWGAPANDNNDQATDGWGAAPAENTGGNRARQDEPSNTGWQVNAASGW